MVDLKDELRCAIFCLFKIVLGRYFFSLFVCLLLATLFLCGPAFTGLFLFFFSLYQTIGLLLYLSEAVVCVFVFPY